MGFFDSLFQHLYGKEQPAAPAPPSEAPAAVPEPVPTATPKARKAKARKKPTEAPSPKRGKGKAPPESSGALDAGQFLPIARDELAQQARKVQRWGPFFGRRN